MSKNVDKNISNYNRTWFFRVKFATRAVSTSGAAVRCCSSPPPPHHQLVVVMYAEEVALLHKRIYKNKKEFSINVLHNVSHAYVFSCLFL
jgi:hypothetical protein